MRQYIQPCTEIISVQMQSSVLVGSNNMPVKGAESQIKAW